MHCRVVLIVLLLFVSWKFHVQAAEIKTCSPITEDGVISLTQDLNFTTTECITVAHGLNIVIEGNGHTILYQGDNYQGIGISSTNSTQLTVRNLKFSGAFQSLVSVDYSQAFTFSDNSADTSAVQTLVNVTNSQNVTIKNNTFYSTLVTAGIFVGTSRAVLVQQNTFTDNKVICTGESGDDTHNAIFVNDVDLVSVSDNLFQGFSATNSCVSGSVIRAITVASPNAYVDGNQIINMNLTLMVSDPLNLFSEFTPITVLPNSLMGANDCSITNNVIDRITTHIYMAIYFMPQNGSVIVANNKIGQATHDLTGNATINIHSANAKVYGNSLAFDPETINYAIAGSASGLCTNLERATSFCYPHNVYDCCYLCVSSYFCYMDQTTSEFSIGTCHNRSTCTEPHSRRKASVSSLAPRIDDATGDKYTFTVYGENLDVFHRNISFFANGTAVNFEYNLNSKVYQILDLDVESETFVFISVSLNGTFDPYAPALPFIASDYEPIIQGKVLVESLLVKWDPPAIYFSPVLYYHVYIYWENYETNTDVILVDVNVTETEFNLQNPSWGHDHFVFVTPVTALGEGNAGLNIFSAIDETQALSYVSYGIDVSVYETTTDVVWADDQTFYSIVYVNGTWNPASGNYTFSLTAVTLEVWKVKYHDRTQELVASIQVNVETFVQDTVYADGAVYFAIRSGFLGGIVKCETNCTYFPSNPDYIPYRMVLGYNNSLWIGGIAQADSDSYAVLLSVDLKGDLSNYTLVKNHSTGSYNIDLVFNSDTGMVYHLVSLPSQYAVFLYNGTYGFGYMNLALYANGQALMIAYANNMVITYSYNSGAQVVFYPSDPRNGLLNHLNGRAVTDSSAPSQLVSNEARAISVPITGPSVVLCTDPDHFRFYVYSLPTVPQLAPYYDMCDSKFSRFFNFEIDPETLMVIVAGRATGPFFETSQLDEDSTSCFWSFRTLLPNPQPVLSYTANFSVLSFTWNIPDYVPLYLLKNSMVVFSIEMQLETQDTWVAVYNGTDSQFSYSGPGMFTSEGFRLVMRYTSDNSTFFSNVVYPRKVLKFSNVNTSKPARALCNNNTGFCYAAYTDKTNTLTKIVIHADGDFTSSPTVPSATTSSLLIGPGGEIYIGGRFDSGVPFLLLPLGFAVEMEDGYDSMVSDANGDIYACGISNSSNSKITITHLANLGGSQIVITVLNDPEPQVPYVEIPIVHMAADPTIPGRLYVATLSGLFQIDNLNDNANVTQLFARNFTQYYDLIYEVAGNRLLFVGYIAANETYDVAYYDLATQEFHDFINLRTSISKSSHAGSPSLRGGLIVSGISEDDQIYLTFLTSESETGENHPQFFTIEGTTNGILDVWQNDDLSSTVLSKNDAENSLYLYFWEPVPIVTPTATLVQQTNSSLGFSWLAPFGVPYDPSYYYQLNIHYLNGVIETIYEGKQTSWTLSGLPPAMRIDLSLQLFTNQSGVVPFYNITGFTRVDGYEFDQSCDISNPGIVLLDSSNKNLVIFNLVDNLATFSSWNLASSSASEGPSVNVSWRSETSSGFVAGKVSLFENGDIHLVGFDNQEVIPTWCIFSNYTYASEPFCVPFSAMEGTNNVYTNLLEIQNGEIWVLGATNGDYTANKTGSALDLDAFVSIWENGSPKKYLQWGTYKDDTVIDSTYNPNAGVVYAIVLAGTDNFQQEVRLLTIDTKTYEITEIPLIQPPDSFFYPVMIRFNAYTNEVLIRQIQTGAKKRLVDLPSQIVTFATDPVTGHFSLTDLNPNFFPVYMDFTPVPWNAYEYSFSQNPGDTSSHVLTGNNDAYFGSFTSFDSDSGLEFTVGFEDESTAGYQFVLDPATGNQIAASVRSEKQLLHFNVIPSQVPPPIIVLASHRSLSVAWSPVAQAYQYTLDIVSAGVHSQQYTGTTTGTNFTLGATPTLPLSLVLNAFVYSLKSPSILVKVTLPPFPAIQVLEPQSSSVNVTISNIVLGAITYNLQISSDNKTFTNVTEILGNGTIALSQLQSDTNYVLRLHMQDFLDVVYFSDESAFRTPLAGITSSDTSSTSATTSEATSDATSAATSASSSPLTSSTGSSANSTAVLPTTTSNSHHHKRHTGAIIGGVLGGVALLALVALLAFLLLRRKRRTMEPVASAPTFERTGGTKKAKFGLEAFGSGYSMANVHQEEDENSRL